MANWSVATRPLIAATIVEPSSGRWVATVEVSGVDALPSDVVIRCENGPREWRGHVAQQSSMTGRVRAIVRPLPELEKAVVAKGYFNTSSRIVAQEAASDAGATLGPSSTTSTSLQHWARAKATLSEALDVLCRSTGDAWRVLRSGELSVGKPTFSDVSGRAIEMHRNTELGSVEFALDDPFLGPWVTYNGERISDVEYTVNAGGCVVKAFLA